MILYSSDLEIKLSLHSLNFIENVFNYFKNLIHLWHKYSYVVELILNKS
jgi:hypothetical protein